MVIPFGTGGGIWRKNKVPERLPFNIFLQEIRSGNLKSGDKILNERQLADLLGISRVPLREAICTLSTLGILEAHQGNGTYVSEKNAQIFSSVIKKYGNI